MVKYRIFSYSLVAVFCFKTFGDADTECTNESLTYVESMPDTISILRNDSTYFSRHQLANIDELPNDEVIAAYVQRFWHVAKREQTKFGIPMHITLIQGGLESGWSESYLASEWNNHFGIKAGSLDERVCLNTNENYGNGNKRYKRCFKAYDSAWLSFRDHSLLFKNGLKRNPDHYAILFRYGITPKMDSIQYWESVESWCNLLGPNTSHKKRCDKVRLADGSWDSNKCGTGYATEAEYPYRLFKLCRKVQDIIDKQKGNGLASK